MAAEGLWTVQFSETEEFYDNLQVGEEINHGSTFVLTNNRVFGGGISFSGTINAEQVRCTPCRCSCNEMFDQPVLLSRTYPALSHAVLDSTIYVLSGTAPYIIH